MDFSECLREIVESARLRRLAVLAGAGISRNPPSSLPLANDLKLYIVEKICSAANIARFYGVRLGQEGDISKKIKSYPLEAMIEHISRNHEILSALAELFKTGSPNKNHNLIARLVQKGFLREVLTTNFDLLIEDALKNINSSKGVKFNVYYAEKQFSEAILDSSLPTIYKIHGSADDKDSMRITLSQVASQAMSESRVRILTHFFGSGSGDILVLGYSLGDEFDINPALSTINSKKRVFYVHHKPSTQEIAQLPRVLHDFEGYSIRCSTDRVVDFLWSELMDDR